MSEPQSLHIPNTPPIIKKSQSHLEDILHHEESLYWTIFDEVMTVLFPTLSDWSEKTTFAKLNALIAVPLVLVFTLTLPIAETDDVKVDDVEVINPALEDNTATPQVVVLPSGQENSSNVDQNKRSYLTVPTSERSIPDLLIVEEDLPVLEELAPIGWCRWLVAVQAICSTTFVTSVMACKW